MKIFSGKYTGDLLLREEARFRHFFLQYGTQPPHLSTGMLYTEAEKKYFSAKNTIREETYWEKKLFHWGGSRSVSGSYLALHMLTKVQQQIHRSTLKRYADADIQHTSSGTPGAYKTVIKNIEAAASHLHQ